MTTDEALHRGNNLVSVTLITLAGFAFASEIFMEDELTYKVDDILILLLGLGAIAWYNRSGNKYRHSLLPFLFVFAALLVKIAAIFVELHDSADIGDDFGALTLFIFASVVAFYLYRQSARKEKRALTSE